MNEPTTEARIRLAQAEALRATLEEAHFEAITSDYDQNDRDLIRGLWGEAMVRETIARIQARQLGVAS